MGGGKEKIMAKEKGKKAADAIHKSSEPHMLPCKLSTKGKAEAAVRLAKAIQQIESYAIEKKSVLADFKSRAEGLTKTIHELTRQVTDGVEICAVDCELILNYTKLTAKLTRKDTGEIVEDRTMTEDEKQMTFDLEDAKDDREE